MNDSGPPFASFDPGRSSYTREREMFEAELAKTRHLDPKQGLVASGTAVG